MGDKNILRLWSAATQDSGNRLDIPSGGSINLVPAVNDQGVLNVGNNTTSMDMKVWLGGDGSYVEFNNGAKSIVLSGVTMAAGNTALADAEVITFGDASDFSLGFDGTQLEFLPVTDDTGAVNIGDGTKDADFKVFLGTTSAYFQCDVGNGQVNIEGAELHLGDSDLIEFGDATAGDFTLGFDGSQLEFLPTTDDTGAVNIGDGTTDADFKVFLGTTSAYFQCDVGEGQVNIEGAELHLGDTDKLEFGDGAGGDVTIDWNSAQLNILALADDEIIKFGNGTNSFDIWTYGNAATDYILCDAGANKQSFVGEYFPAMKTPVAITGNATLNATHFGALVQSNGAANTDILTLPDAAAGNAGAWIYAQRIVDFGWTVATNTADTLVGVNNASADSVTFNTANEKIGSCGLFVSDGALWHFFPSAGGYTLNDA